MGPSELEEMTALAAGMERDDLEEFLDVSVDCSPPEQLSLISSALYTKTNNIEHLDQALRWAEEAAAAAAATSNRDCAAGLRFLGTMLSRNSESFLRATRLGLANILGELVEAGFDIEGHGIHGRALLHEACRGGCISVARVLLERGFDPNARDARNETPLLAAAWSGNEPIVRLLLEHGADMEAEDQDGDSALHTAAYHGFEGVARALLEHGAKKAVCGGSGWTPMQWALNRRHLGVAQLLLDFGAFPDLADDTRVPLHQIPGGDIYRQIELAQRLMFPASSTLGWLGRMRFVVAAGEGSDHHLELIEPGPEGTLAEPYIAISYCWGRTWSRADPLLIRVPSRDGPKVRETKASRDVLLRSLEYAAAKGVKRIWIDQECIHQDDDEDKKDALQNMHLVYRRAKATLVLLDRHVRTSAEIASLHDTILPRDKCPDMKARIVADRWFTRAWTCQEFGVTPTENLRYLVGWDKDLDVSGHRWELASKSFNLRSGDLIVQNIPRAWEFSHREIGGLTFQVTTTASAKINGLSGENVMFGNRGEDEIIYTLSNDGVEDMYWWKHGLSFKFGVPGRDILPDVPIPNPEHPKPPRPRQDSPELQMTILAALFVQLEKRCTVFSDKLAILGNLTGYPYRLHPSEAFEKQLSFSACVLAMALFNGDLSPLFTNDLAFLRLDGEAAAPPSSLLSQTNLYMLAAGRSPHSRFRGQITAGSKCLVLGGQLLVEGILWRIVPFTGLQGLEKTTSIKPTTAAKRDSDDAKDPIRFYFFQNLVRRLVALGRIDILEVVVASVMRRQLTSPLELVHLLHALQAWSRNEQHWPAHIADESFLERKDDTGGTVCELANGQRRKTVRHLRYRDNARGVDFAIMEMESDDDTEPRDLLSHIHRAVLCGRPLALGECKVGDETLVSLFKFDPDQYRWILAPLNELDYEFGKNPWMHLFPKDTFWCVEKGEKTVSGDDLRRALGVLGLGADGEKRVSNETLKVETSGARSGITGTWSPRLSRRGVLTIGDDGAWRMIPLGQGTRSVRYEPASTRPY
ncbi:hypothetical protein DL765_002788 [Monosporascus sp. GIB2]|nr:hypothetical protein DL765_002788 [Monosporascus sp. GIB2]